MKKPDTFRSSIRVAFERAGLGRPALAAWLRLNRPELIQHDWDVWRDLARFRSRYPFLAEKPDVGTVVTNKMKGIRTADFHFLL